MPSPRLSTVVLSCALSLAAGNLSPAQAAPLPQTIQQALLSGIQRSPDSYVGLVHKLVEENKALAQEIVNAAAMRRPELTNQLVETANNALRGKADLYSIAASRQPFTPPPPASSLGSGWVIGGAAVAVAGGTAVALSGGGGSSSNPSAAQLEYLANYGLGLTNTQSAYNHGSTGSGVLVAVADSGIDTNHPELIGQFVNGQNFMYGGATPNDIEDDPTGIGHGTLVSGVIVALKNNTGMQGVAYNAKVLPVRIFDNYGSTNDTETAAAVAYAVAQGADIYNGSYGFNGTANIAASQNELDAYQAAISSGMILVFATGNSGLSNPGLPAALPYVKPANDGSGLYTNNTSARDYSATAAQLIAVTSVNSSGVISSFANRCGVAAAWCLAAPGEGIYTTSVDGSYETVNGTSFSAPMVSGGLALLREQYPSLTPAQTVTRLLTSATRTGIYADSSIYGQGLMNLGAATSFIATAMVPTTTSLSGPAYTLSASQFKLASPFGDSLKTALASESFKAVDSFDGAAISVEATKIVADTATSNHLDDGVRRFGTTQTVIKGADETNTLSLREVAGNSTYNAKTEAHLTTRFSEDTQTEISYMADPALGFGLMAEGRVNDGESRSEGAFLSPYTKQAANGVSFISQSKFGGVTVRGGMFLGSPEEQNSDDLTSNSESSYGGIAEMSFTPFAGSRVVAQSGFVQEKQSFLGSQTSGAFALDSSTTNFIGLSGSVELGAGFELLGSYTMGQSQISAAQASLVDDFSSVQSDAFSLGLIKHAAWRAGDRLGFMINQPLRVSGGSTTLSLPNGVDSALQVSYQSTNASLTPTGREMDVETFYATPLSDKAQLNASLLYRHQPDNDASASDEVQGLVRWQKKY